MANISHSDPNSKYCRAWQRQPVIGSSTKMGSKRSIPIMWIHKTATEADQPQAQQGAEAAPGSALKSPILPSENDLYNWNRVYMRYCDGSSCTGDVEEVDHANELYFRSARVFNAIVEELMSLGMKDAQNVLFSGCSAGGLASTLLCDKFHGFFPPSTKVKCIADAGYFPHVKDLSGEYRFEQYFDKIVTLHGSANSLPSGCTSNMKPGLCFFPEFTMPYINTPIFVVNSAFDTWQVANMFATNESDPNGEFTKCKNDLKECSTSQLQRLQEFRSGFLGSINSVTKSPTEGRLINTCYTHCQTDESTRFANATSKLGDKTIAEGVDDWYNDRSEFQKIDTEHVDPHYC
ncbi:pectin acetylesterase 7-like [Bidens hawaiensis]|uniref:pectin acetylesterase 7-like n=1 Tax=Bidens hawaiensis TaxID=980011 RepID=UPI00404A9339